MITKGIRGAITVDENSSEAIGSATIKLLQEIVKLNNIDINLISHVIFSLTQDLNADFPAKYARVNLKWSDVPMMCFNEIAHNRDDHSKNFSFLYDESADKWMMSPAYDLTYSSSVNGEHATTINGNGLNPSDSDIINVGTDSGLEAAWCERTLEEMRYCLNNADQLIGFN